MEWLKKHYLEKPAAKFINQLTFRDVYEQVGVLAKKLNPYVQDERRVALWANNSVDMALFFFALQVLRKEVLLLNTRLTADEITKQLQALHIQTVFSEDDRFIPFYKVCQGQADNLELKYEFDAEQIAVIMNTSATTGAFKSVPLRWKQFHAHVQASQTSLGITAADNWLIVLPMYHIGGLTILLRSLYNGTQATILPGFTEAQVISLLAGGSINMVSVVPTLLKRIVHRIEKHNLRVVLLGGEFVPASLVESCIKKNIPVYKTFGMTETTSQSATFSVLAHRDKLNAVGLPLAGVQFSIQKPDETGCGEILIKSPMLMDGYIGQENISGYFNTEDVGYIDEDGFLYILDRRQNIIISGGENIYPQEIENVLYELPGIVECAVVAHQDEKWGQVPALYVVSALPAAAIFSHLSRKLAKYKLPKKIIQLAELPKNAVGKIAKRDLAGAVGDAHQTEFF